MLYVLVLWIRFYEVECDIDFLNEDCLLVNIKGIFILMKNLFLLYINFSWNRVIVDEYDNGDVEKY